MNQSLPLGIADVFALAFFLAAWIIFALAADGKIVKRISLTQAMNEFHPVERTRHANTRHDDIGCRRQRECIRSVPNYDRVQFLEAEVVRVHLSVISGVLDQQNRRRTL